MAVVRQVVARRIFQCARLTAAIALVLAVSGCSSIGPTTVPRDRLDYLGALSTSWKQQTLSNAVSIRYGDAPVFLDVSSIVSAYDLQANATFGQTSNALSYRGAAQLPWTATTVGAGVTYADRPTISYTPLSGEKLTRRLLRPIPPLGIFELIQAGNPAEIVLQIAVRSLNGIRNLVISGSTIEPADPEFYPLIEALGRLQVDGRLSVRTEKRNGEEIGVFIISEGRRPQSIQDAKFVRDVLKLRPDKNGEITITFSAHQRAGHELAVLSRSMGDILIDVAMGIDVPASHIASGRTVRTLRPSWAAAPRDQPLVQIRTGSIAPARAYASVSYGDTAYWIDDDDYASKRTFTLLMLFMSLAETGVIPQIPTLTLPVR